MPDTPNTRDGGADAPRLRIGLSLITLMSLPDWSRGPRGPDALHAVREAGFEAVQTRDPAAARDAGLVPTALARVDRPQEARDLAIRHRDAGYDCTTLHVGSGFESDDEALALVDAIVEASVGEGHPLFVETHRATLTQDMKRTLDLVEHCPGVRFNGDFSHWYTGAEMTYGDIAAKIARLAPVFERTRFLHGRVSDPGCIQVPVADDPADAHVAVFRDLWTRSFAGFLASARPGDCMGFYPELLPASFFYARRVPDASGQLREEADRWTEALKLVDLARACWADAIERRQS
jgi:hypothetical protein